MTIRTALAALVLALAPALAYAQCSKGPAQSASTCGDGQVWDTKTQACVPKPST